jgi:hypothetical protein
MTSQEKFASDDNFLRYWDWILNTVYNLYITLCEWLLRVKEFSAR